MDAAAVGSIAAWATRAGLEGMAEPELVRGFCERVVAAGIPLARVNLFVDTLHPVHEGHLFRWRRDPADAEAARPSEYARSETSAEVWRRSPFHYLLQSGGALLRRNLARGDPADFTILEDIAAEGHTDYVALIHRFAAEGAIGDMDCVYSSWCTDAPGGFADAEVAALVEMTPPLALAVKAAALARIAGTLVETYLGRDAGRRVLSGRIERGVADRIHAVLWFSDLRGFTRITDASAPEQIIPLLNGYADAVVSAVHEAGGDVLKLIGDGTLAIFKADEPAAACSCALTAEASARERITALNERRAADGLPVTQAYLGLHLGEVFYGNIGSRDRLDFTVVGPAVNETSRIATLCRSVERDVLLSEAFAAAAAPEDRARFVSVGRFALRGVGRAQELFTLEHGDGRLDRG
ncbi:MAG: adenylate/guanylate cyclase domain-containing protein [Geminicoccaceae bacterium]